MASLGASPWRNKLLNELCTLIISSTREKNLRALPKGRRCSKERIINTTLSISLSLSISAAGACPTLLPANLPHLLQHSCCCCCCCCTNCMQFRVMFKWLLSCQADPSRRVPRVLMMLHWRLVAYDAAQCSVAATLNYEKGRVKCHLAHVAYTRRLTANLRAKLIPCA